VAWWLVALAFVWLLGVWPPPLWWRTHWPEQTAMMRRTPSPSDRPTVRRISLSEIPPALQRMIIIAEDSRFRTHWGIDVIELREAARAGLRRGASTITQQLAKNLYLSPSRSPLRKLKEAATAVRLEWALSKDRIMELYLNVVEWGPGIWGLDAASRTYFGVSPRGLSDQQAAALAATLPHPRSSNPHYRPERMLTRRDLILARYRGRDVVIPPLVELDLDSILEVDSLVDSLIVPPAVPPLPESLPPAPDSTRDSVPPNDTGPASRRP
jgi:monofunctional biosynthetic peptidoglycan transglycosylase